MIQGVGKDNENLTITTINLMIMVIPLDTQLLQTTSTATLPTTPKPHRWNSRIPGVDRCMGPVPIITKDNHRFCLRGTKETQTCMLNE